MLRSKTQKANLRLLREGLAGIEHNRRQRLRQKDDRAVVNRDAAQAGLTGVCIFLMEHGIETKPLDLILRDLANVTGGSMPSAMFSPIKINNRRPAATTLDILKGQVAAIFEYRQKQGVTPSEAAEWVLRNRPALAVQPGTVRYWYSKWGGKTGATPGAGRSGYEHMRAILEERQPTELKLKGILTGLEE